MTVRGEGAHWWNTDVADRVYIGNAGIGTLDIGAGGQVTTNGRVYVGDQEGGRGAVTVQGGDARWNVEGRLFIGSGGQGQLTVEAGGRVSIRDLMLGRQTAGAGTLNLNAGGILQMGGNMSAGAGAAIFNLAGGTVQVAGSNLRNSLDMVLSDISTIDTQGYDAELSGVMSGAGGLNKSGAGTLLLSGTHVYSGVTTVQAGRLVVGGSSGSTARVGAVQVENGALLGGHGTVGNTVIAAGGILAPGDSIGALTVAGDLSFTDGSTYRVEVDPAGSVSDRVQVTGTARLRGSVVHIGNDGGYRPLSTYRILTAGTLDGEFDDVQSNYAFLTPALSYETLPDATRAVDLTLARNQVGLTSVGRTRNQVATAQAVDSLGAGHSVYDVMVGMPDDPASIQRGYDALSGEVHASAQSTLLMSGLVLRDASNQRLRSAFSGVGAGYAPIRVAGAGGLAGMVTPRSGLGAWATSFGSWNHQEGDGNAATLRQDTAGFLVGADRPVGDWRIGALAGYSHSSFNVDGRASSGKGDSYHLGLYGGRQWGALGLRGGLSHTWHQLDTRRSVAVGGFSERLKADYRARTLQAYGEVSYRIDTDAVSLEPYADLAHVRLRTGAYAEQGGTAALSSDGRTTDITFATLGARASRDLTVGTRDASVYGALGWRHALSHVRPSVTHAFAVGESFTVTGAPIARDAAVIEAGLDLRMSDTATLGVSYAGQLAAGARDHAVSASLRVAF